MFSTAMNSISSSLCLFLVAGFVYANPAPQGVSLEITTASATTLTPIVTKATTITPIVTEATTVTPDVTSAPIVTPGTTSRTVVCKKKYHFFTDRLNWARAMASCKSNGLSFATIKSQADHDQFIADRIEKGILTGQIWVAGYDPTNKSKFVWMTDLQPFVYMNWALGYPKVSPGSQCVYVDDYFTWVNDVCLLDRMYACEECLL